MKKHLKQFGLHFELYIGSIFLSITALIVIVNVFTRYFLHFTFTWAEEVAVGCFVWVIFLGLANAYKTKGLIGVEVLTNMVPEKGKPIVAFITSLIVSVLSVVMLVFSYKYVSGSTKITAALELSYKYIYVSMIFAFAIITGYSIYFLIQSFRKIFINDSVSIMLEDDLDQNLMDEQLEMFEDKGEKK